MNRRQFEDARRLYARLDAAGFDADETARLISIEKTLSRWAERECNGEIERDGNDGNGRPYASNAAWGGKHLAYPIPDRERGALRRLAVIMAQHPEWIAYHQGDPRGCALWLVRKADIPTGADVGAYYTRGIAVCY